MESNEKHTFYMASSVHMCLQVAHPTSTSVDLELILEFDMNSFHNIS